MDIDIDESITESIFVGSGRHLHAEFVNRCITADRQMRLFTLCRVGETFPRFTFDYVTKCFAILSITHHNVCTTLWFASKNKDARDLAFANTQTLIVNTRNSHLSPSASSALAHLASCIANTIDNCFAGPKS